MSKDFGSSPIKSFCQLLAGFLYLQLVSFFLLLLCNGAKNVLHYAEPTLCFWTDLIFVEVHSFCRSEDTSRVLPLASPPQMIFMPILEICLMDWLSHTMSSVQRHFFPDYSLLKKPQTTTNKAICYSYYW